MSRAAAIITYRKPKGDDARRIWKIHGSRLLGKRFTDRLLNEVAEHFPSASGRDIQRVLALAARVCDARDREPDLDLLRQCAVFKGLVMDDHKEES